MEPSGKIAEIDQRFARSIAIADRLLESMALKGVIYDEINTNPSANNISLAMLHAEGYVEPIPTKLVDTQVYCITIKGYRRVIEHLQQQKTTDPLRGQKPPSAIN